MKLVENIGKAWTWLSMQFMAAAVAAEVAWASLPPETLSSIPDEWQHKITIALVVMGMIGRVIKQEKTE